VEIDPPDTCWVDVVIDEEVLGLTGYDLEIQFDDAVLDLNGVVEGPRPSSGGADTFFFWTLEGPPATIVIHGAILGASVNGPGVLATIEFLVPVEGWSPVAFTLVELRDILNQPIPVVAVDGEIVTPGVPVEDATWTAIKALYLED